MSNQLICNLALNVFSDRREANWLLVIGYYYLPMSRSKLALVTIILLALALRIFAIIQDGDFWFDAWFSFNYSQKPWLDSFKFWTWETNPPFHMVVLKFWFYIFPKNELFARLPSLIFGVTSIYFLLLFRIIFNSFFNCFISN